MRQVKNKVFLEGYLKESTLKCVINARNEEVISGNLIIATDANQSFRIQCYVNKFKKLKEGETVAQENPTYSKLVKFVSDSKETTSIASILKEKTPSIEFDIAKELATKVWAFATLQEYVYKKDNNEVISSTSLKLISADIKEPTDKKPFAPKAKFDIEMYIESKMNEIKDQEETGRVVLTGLIPEYDDSVSRISFVTGTAQAHQYIQDNYEVGQTVNVVGELISLVRTESKVDNAKWFGTPQQETYETTFVNERQITGGCGVPWEEGDDNAFTAKEIKEGLAKRQQKIDELQTKDKKIVNVEFGGFGTGNLEF